MPHLNLVPDLQLILAQITLFLINLYLVKKLWLEPFLRLGTERKIKTETALAKAQELLASSGKKRAELQQLLSEAKLKARREAQSIVDKAEKDAKHELEKARQEALLELDEIRQQIHRLREAEAARIPTFVDGIVEHIAKKLA